MATLSNTGTISSWILAASPAKFLDDHVFGCWYPSIAIDARDQSADSPGEARLMMVVVRQSEQFNVEVSRRVLDDVANGTRDCLELHLPLQVKVRPKISSNLNDSR